MKMHRFNIIAKYLNEMHHKQFEDQFEICLLVHLLWKKNWQFWFFDTFAQQFCLLLIFLLLIAHFFIAYCSKLILILYSSFLIASIKILYSSFLRDLTRTNFLYSFLIASIKILRDFKDREKKRKITKKTFFLLL